jgi:hypothetical protein
MHIGFWGPQCRAFLRGCSANCAVDRITVTSTLGYFIFIGECDLIKCNQVPAASMGRAASVPIQAQVTLRVPDHGIVSTGLPFAYSVVIAFAMNVSRKELSIRPWPEREVH